MYQFNYQCDDNDYFAFNQYHLENSVPGKKALLTFRLVIPVFCILVIMIFLVAHADAKFIIMESVILLIISVLWIIFAKKMYLQSIKKGIRKMHKKGKLPYSSQGTLSFGEQEITDSGSIGETKVCYSAIEKIGVTDQAIYLYFTAIQAFILPTSCFNSEKEKQDFLSFILAKIAG